MVVFLFPVIFNLFYNLYHMDLWIPILYFGLQYNTHYFFPKIVPAWQLEALSVGYCVSLLHPYHCIF